jgi:hypothetical protein
MFYIMIDFYIAALGLIKLQILLQYLRIFTGTMRTVSIVATVVVCCWSTASLFADIFACVPIAKFWDQSINGYCLPVPTFWYVNAAGNITTDLIIFTLPIIPLWKLQLPLSQRLSLVGVFSLGFL